jgi:hypothetical protein
LAIWGSAPDDTYVVGYLGSDPAAGRIYHFDGAVWQRMTEFGDLAQVQDVWGSGSNDVWFALRDGRLLHIGPSNTPPFLTVDHAAVAVDEGQTAANSGTVSDGDGDLVALSASMGTVTDNQDGTWSWSYTADEGPVESTITIAADDSQDTAQVAFALSVNNLAPTVGEISAPLNPVQLGATIDASADFSDPGALDTHTAIWDWGDGSISTGTVNETDGSGTVDGSHSYPEAGVYTVGLTVTDDDGDSDAVEFKYVVVYDPEGGFVTGGGWIWSKVGYCQLGDACAAVEGKANYGFVSKYKKGASAPTGNTQFEFQAGNLNFHSSSYDWLVIAGSKAMYKGVGTVNGQGNYGFLISAVDAKLSPSTDIDLFRLKVWDRDNHDFVVYDNMMGKEEDSDPTTAIGGGNIVIHQ